jgi:ubiquinone biosynthesis protein
VKPREMSPLRPVLKALLDPVARASLCKRMAPAEARHLLDHTWQLYPAHLQAVDNSRKPGIGPALVLRLAACTITLHAALVEKGETHDGAIRIVAEVGWAVYRRMGRIPWTLSGIISRDAGKRLLISTRVFRRFPFGPSAYVWKSRPAPEGVVAFDCLRCPVAEHFAQVGLSDLCVHTFCELDFPLAQDWSAVLQRTSSIAAGASVCDFRWHANSAMPLATAERAPLL